MRYRATAMGLVLAGLTAGAAMAPARPADAAESYCPNAAHAAPAKVPPDLAASVAKAFQIDAAMVRDAAYVRCVGAQLMGCYIGANIPCFKANTRRTLPGATAWCRDNPGSKFIPMSATGHDTIYDWSCKGRSAVAGKAISTVDPKGYIAESWKEIP
jgi:hypothetical protein